MDVVRNVGLKNYNTFLLEASANAFVRVTCDEEVEQAVRVAETLHLPLKILGGGSNILLTSNQDALIAKMEVEGISHIQHHKAEVVVTAGAGCDWESLVNYAADHELWGIENLTLIPGKVGSSPIQNIGAYGVELKDVFQSLRAYDCVAHQFVELNYGDCRFGYRDSFFKNEGRNRFIIVSVSILLSKVALPHIQYGQVAKALETKGTECPKPIDVVEAIRAIRRAKLPDTAVVGSAGSFFKNPVIANELAQKIVANEPDVPVYPLNDHESKVAAGWLIERCGWKGYRNDDVGVWPHQALVLVNYGNASGIEIMKLADDIIASVVNRFGIRLEPEVNFW